MNQSRKYEKTYHLAVPQFDKRGKHVLTDSEARALLAGKVDITEKMDGSNTGIYKSKGQTFLQKRGGWMDDSHEQFKYFKNQWYWQNLDKIQAMPDNMVIYGELMYCTHSIYYDRLPDYWLVFDIFDLRQKRYMTWPEIAGLCQKSGLATVPHIASGHYTASGVGSLIPKESAYGKLAEGVVVKNYARQLRAKMVWPAFIKTLDESDHWANQTVRYNNLEDDSHTSGNAGQRASDLF